MTKFFLLMLLFSKLIFAQEWYIGSAVAFSIAAGITEGLQLEERELYGNNLDNGKRIKLNKLWHKTQVVERGLGIGVGIAIGEYSKLDWKKLLASTLLSAAIFWNLYDATINIVRGNHFFYQSKTTFSPIDKYADFKIPVLGIALALNYILLNN